MGEGGIWFFTFEDPHGGWEVVYPSGCFESCDDDDGGGDEIIGESVVQVALGKGQQGDGKEMVRESNLEFENVVNIVEFFFVPRRCMFLAQTIPSHFD